MAAITAEVWGPGAIGQGPWMTEGGEAARSLLVLCTVGPPSRAQLWGVLSALL